MSINGGGMLQNRTKFPKNFVNFQACPSSNAAIERIFSNFSFVNSKIWNKLTVSNVSKLVYYYDMLKQEFLCNDDGDEA